MSLLFHWNDESMLRFVAPANTHGPEFNKPQWITTQDGQMNLDTLKRDIVAYLIPTDGNGASFGHVFVGPNCAIQLTHIIQKMTGMEMSRYIQRLMAIVKEQCTSTHPTTSSYFARIAMFSDDGKRPQNKLMPKQFHWSSIGSGNFTLFE